MPRFEPWQIVAVPFPYVERPIQQRRPALIVAAGLGEARDLLWVLMITAAANRRWPDDVEIDDHTAAGLPIPSVVRTAKLQPSLPASPTASEHCLKSTSGRSVRCCASGCQSSDLCQRRRA
jgi:mRNA interferase MazF